MANGGDSGVTNGGQTSLEQQETAQVTKDIERAAEERYKYLREELPKTSPIPIPESSEIIETHKEHGYDQVLYKWWQDGYKYESRWHTHTPNAPEYSKVSWVVERTRPGVGAGKGHRPKIHEILIKGRGWVPYSLWEDAKTARRLGKETKETRELLDNGHWQV